MKKKHLLLILLMVLLAPWAANAQTTIYSENFDSMSSEADLTAAGWISAGNSGCYIGITTSYHVSGSKSLLISAWDGGSSSDSEIAALPVLSQAINGLQITLSYRQRTGGTVQVGYITDVDDASTFVLVQSLASSTSGFTTTTVDLSTVPAGAARIAIKQYTWYDCYIDDIVVETLPTCFKPTALTVTLTPGDGTVATLNWTASGEETAWVLDYDTKSDFSTATSVNVSGTPSKNLTGLTAEATYYARVKADCGGGDESDWSATCSFQPTNKTVIGSGDATNSNLPTYTYFNYSISQQIYTSTELGDAGYIESIDFYCSAVKTRDLDIYMVHTDKDSFSNSTDWIIVSSGDKVFSGSVAFTAGAWKTIELNSGFNYNGTQNIAIIVVDNTGSYVNNPTFKAFSATSQAIYKYNDDDPYDPTSTISVSGTVLNVKNQIRILKGEAPSCFPPTGLTIGEVTNHTAALSWTPAEGQTAWHVYYSESDVAPADDIALNKVIEVETNPAHTLTGLDAETDYYVWVRGNCGVDGYSSWNGPQSFTTEVACAEPTELTISEIGSTTAVVNWTSEAEEATIRYAKIPDASSSSSWLQYDDDTYESSLGNSSSYTWTWGVMYPANQITGDILSKIALYETEYNTGNITLNIYFGGEDRPGTLVHTQTITPEGSGIHEITLDNPVYVYPGKNLWIVLQEYGTYVMSMCESTETNNQWVFNGSSWVNITALGDFGTYGWMIRGYMETMSYEWTTNTYTGNSHQITGLDSETDYIVQARSVCGGIDGNSLWIINTFSTFANCPVPTGLAAANLTQNSADLSWTASSDVSDYTVEYRTAAGEGALFKENFESAASFANWTFTSMNTANDIASGKAGRLEAAAHTGSYGFRFSSYTSCSTPETYDQYLISPELTVTGELKFYAKQHGTGDDIYVGYSTTTNDLSAFTWGDALELTTSWQAFNLDLPGDVKYIAFHYYGNYKYYAYLDDITIGAYDVPAGSWNEATDEAPNTGHYTITGLTADTKYDIRVASNCNMTYCEPISFTTLAEHNIVFPETGNWTATGFEPDGAPTIEDDVIIRANVTIQNGTNAQANNINLENGAVITVASGATLTINGNVTNGGATKLIVEDGGQLIVKKTGINATVKKSVTHAKGVDGWYTIASPINSNYTYATSITNMIQVPAANYDLYYYLESSRLWKNYKVSSFNITKGTGYLYWNSAGVELAFPGSMTYGDVNVSLTKTAAEPTDDLEGFNLIGNPYPHNIYKGEGTAIENSKAEGYVLAAGFYTLSNNGTWQAGTDNSTAIKPAQGILVQATTAGTLTIKDKTESAAKANNDNIKFSVANNQFEDVTYALFMDEIGLTKINHRNADAPMIYIPQDGENYAIATMGDDTETFGLNFKAMTTGMYTLSAKADGMFSYLHVIDRLTGEDIDMLVDGKYEFIGSPRDNEARFIVRLRYNANGFDNDEFIYQNGDELIVNGEGELQVYDVMGRYVASYNVNGNKRISAEQFSNAVYIFRLIGSDVKTQKIVVR